MSQEEKIQKFTFGKAVFQNLSEENKEKIKNNQKIKSKLQGNYWGISIGIYKDYNWQELLPYMIECQAQELNLYGNNRFQILSQIQYARYVNLKILSLGNNEISNIQPLSFIYFQCLQQLRLCGNKISQIKGLQKLSTPLLDTIQIYSNPLIQINALTRSKINFKKLKHLYLQHSQFSDTIHQDLSVVVKLNNNQIESLQVPSYERINQNKIKNMLKLRSPSLNIYKD